MTRKTRRGTAAALMAAALVAAAPVVCAEDSPQPEVSIIDITEDTLPEPSGDYLPAKIWVEEEDGTHLLKKDLCGGCRRFPIRTDGRKHQPPGDLLPVFGGGQRGTPRYH